MAWTVEFIPEAAQQLRKLDRTAAGRITRNLQETVANGRDPRQRGKRADRQQGWPLAFLGWRRSRDLSDRNGPPAGAGGEGQPLRGGLPLRAITINLQYGIWC